MKKLRCSFIDYFELRYKCGTFVAARKLSLGQGTFFTRVCLFTGGLCVWVSVQGVSVEETSSDRDPLC